MKRLSVVGIVCSALITAAAVSLWLAAVLNLGSAQGNREETFLSAAQSPDGKYTLEAYQTQPGATVDFSVKVYLVDEGQKDLIYNAYHEYEAEMSWVDSERVCINGKTLDLSAGEKYDWRRNE